MFSLMSFAVIPEISLNTLETAFWTVQPLMITLFAIALYAIFILEFYEFVATKDVFKEESAYAKASTAFREKYHGRGFNMFLKVLEYLFLFPLIVFFWAAVFFLIILTVSGMQNIEMILLVSISIVGAIRICAYYSRKIAEDVSKLLPLVLLGNFVLDIKVISLSGTFQTIKNKIFFDPEFLSLALHYLLFLILLEFVLRTINFAWNHRIRVKEEGKEFEEASTKSKKVIADEVEEK